MADASGRSGQESRWAARTGVYVIAEAGVNHNGDPDLAMELVREAARAGADAVKFQTFTPELLATAGAAPADYQSERVTDAQSQLDMLAGLTLAHEAHRTLQAAAQELGLDFLSTGFDTASIDLLVALGVPLLKIPSGEITNLPYLRDVASRGLPVILSTGLADLSEVTAALELLRDAGNQDVTVLHCTTAYPAPMESVNLRAMTTMATELSVPVGYSDHTLGPEISIAAVALGATVIEKHITLDNTMPGPDHAASMEPSDFAEMVSAIRNVESALGDGVKRPQPAEMVNLQAARRSIVAARRIVAGEVFTPDNVTVKRPGSGTSPMQWDQVMGQIARRDYEPDEMIDS